MSRMSAPYNILHIEILLWGTVREVWALEAHRQEERRLGMLRVVLQGLDRTVGD
jgi:hypothetical protein